MRYGWPRAGSRCSLLSLRKGRTGNRGDVVPALLIILTLLLALAGCADETPFNAEVDLGKSLVEALQARRLDAIEARLDHAAVGGGSRAALAKMAALLPTDTPTSIKVAGVNANTVSLTEKGTVRHVALSLQYQFGDKWFLVNARWRRLDTGPPLVESLHVGPLRASLQEINRFALEGKSAIHYTVLALAVVLPLFTLAVFALCLRTPMPRWRKVLWSPVILLGLTPLSLDWTSGAMLWRPVHVLILSGGFNTTELGPVIISIAVPLGAVLFLLRRRRILARSRRGPRRARPGGEHPRPGRARLDHARYPG